MSNLATAPAVVTSAPTAFDCSNMVIDRVVIHQIFCRGPDKKIPPPSLETSLLALPQDGKDALQKRVTSALSSKSHGVEMSIESATADSFLQHAADAIFADDSEFVETSHKLAWLLTKAQGTTSAPAGGLVVLSGKVGAFPKRFLAVIKADAHDGFGAAGSAGASSVTYLTRLLLTPTQKLYKVGLLLEETSGPRKAKGTYQAGNYRAFLFDHLITGVETKEAAAYFYSSFLGMDIQKSARKLTQDFFEHTIAFIESAPVDESERAGMKEALRTELRNTNATINAVEFASKNFPKPLQKPYAAFLEQKGFPKNAVVKDTHYVKTRLRRPKKYEFRDGIRLVVPADVVAGTIRVTSTSPDLTTIEIQGGYRVSD